MRLLSLAFRVDLIIYLTWLLVYFHNTDFLDLLSSLEVLLGLFFFLEVLLILLARVLLSFWTGFFDFRFFFLKILFLSDGLCLSGIYILLNVSFFSKFGRKIVVLEFIFL